MAVIMTKLLPPHCICAYCTASAVRELPYPRQALPGSYACTDKKAKFVKQGLWFSLFSLCTWSGATEVVGEASVPESSWTLQLTHSCVNGQAALHVERLTHVLPSPCLPSPFLFLHNMGM